MPMTHADYALIGAGTIVNRRRTQISKISAVLKDETIISMLSPEARYSLTDVMDELDRDFYAAQEFIDNRAD